MVSSAGFIAVRGTGIISVYMPGEVTLGGSIVIPVVEFVTGVGLVPEPATKMVYESKLHRTQEDMS